MLAPALFNAASLALFACGSIHRYGYPLQLMTMTTALFLMLGVPLGRLPGDIVVRRGNFSFYFPLATSIVVSLLLTLVISFLRR